MTDKLELTVNPKGLMESELPIIWAFANGRINMGGGRFDYCGSAVADDGTILQTWTSSDENWLSKDLGCNSADRKAVHDKYAAKYPDGYRLRYIPTSVKEGEDEEFDAFLKRNGYG